MGINTGIEWTDATWNPWIGCSKVSPGCDSCYMFSGMRRYGRDPGVVQRTKEATFYAPFNWKEPKRIFTCSWSDFFHKQADPWREEAWEVILRTPHHTYQILTKRPGLMVAWAETHPWPDHVWAGTSVERQKYAPRLDVLARVPAKVRFVSAEPLLSSLDLRKWLNWTGDAGMHEPPDPVCLNWVIVGGESGPNARPMHPDWARSLRDQCHMAGVPYFHKQNGEWVSGLGVLGGYVVLQNTWSEDHPFGNSQATPSRNIHQWGDGYLSVKVGKKAAGALLDGREHKEMP